MARTVRYAALVYQAGIANVFVTAANFEYPTHRNARRIFQGDFYGAECVAHGLAAAGVHVRSFACNQAGDITNAVWDTPMDEAPFRDHMHPVNHN